MTENIDIVNTITNIENIIDNDNITDNIETSNNAIKTENIIDNDNITENIETNKDSIKTEIILDKSDITENINLINTEKPENKDNIIKAEECLIIDCEKCNYNNKYSCKDCKKDYSLNDKYDYCYIKQSTVPTVIFKDIYKFSTNNNLDINGIEIKVFLFTLRGLTDDNILENHLFALSITFSIINNLRYLTENTKNFRGFCRYSNFLKKDDSNIKYIDYECYGIQNNEDLSNYEITSINELDNEGQDNIKCLNLNNLVKDINNITKIDSSFKESELEKYILFIANNNSKKVEITKKETYNFNIYGEIDKSFNIINFNVQLKVSNITNKTVDCNLISNIDRSALLICECNFEIIELSFEDQEIIGEKYNVYFKGLNDIQFLEKK